MDNSFIRHYLATLAYRMWKTMDGAHDNFPTFQAGEGVRTPLEILHHTSDVMLMAYRALGQDGEPHAAPNALKWEAEVERFYDVLVALDDVVAAGSEPSTMTWAQIVQGPLADAMTHVGQIAMLRRLAGHPIPGERYTRADIQVGRIRPDGPSSPTNS